MPVAKSLTDVAWAAVASTAREWMRSKKIATLEEAVDELRAVSHPVYMTYLASLQGTPPPLEQPLDIGKRATAVVKTSEAQALAKRQAVQAEITKRAAPLVRRGLSEAEATRQVLNGDRDLYSRWQQSGYASGPLPPVELDTGVVPTGPVQAEVSRLAKALKTDDPWGRYRAASEPELVEEVFRRDPALYWAHRAEVLQ